MTTKEKIFELRSQKKTLEEIGQSVGLTKQRVSQIIKQNGADPSHLIKLTHQPWLKLIVLSERKGMEPNKAVELLISRAFTRKG